MTNPRPPAGPSTPPPPPGPKVAEVEYPVREVAELLRCSPVTVWRRIRDGEIAVVKPKRGRVRITASALADYVARNTTPAKRRVA